MVEYDPFMDEMYDDPFPVYARLRAESPVHYIERHDSWALSLFEDVWNASEDPETFRSPGPSLNSTATQVDEGAGVPQEENMSIFGLNPPQHTEMRKALTKLFTPRKVGRLEEQLRAKVRRRLSECLPTGRADVIADLAAQISVHVACLIIGLPVEDGPELTKIVTRFFAREKGYEGMPPDAQAASRELGEYLKDAALARSRQGFGDENAMDVYAGMRIGGHSYTPEQIAMHCAILVVGGSETLPKVFAGGIKQLFLHPDQRAQLVAEPSDIPAAFMEIARYEMPTQFLTRKMARDLELRGQKMREGQGVIFLYRAANRDAAEFDEPDRFDINRRAPRILAFGHGTHICLGQHAARLEARVMYEELLPAVPEYEVVMDEVVPARSEFVDGYLAMPIVFEPTELPS